MTSSQLFVMVFSMTGNILIGLLQSLSLAQYKISCVQQHVDVAAD